MHLERPMLNTNGNSKKKLSKPQQRALDAHEAWLKSKGLDRKSIKSRKLKLEDRIPDYKVESNAPLSNTVGNGFARGMMANLHKETPEVQKQILEKAQRCAPLYSKGGYQYITDDADKTTLGRKV